MNIFLADGATMPTRGSTHAAGYDLYAIKNFGRAVIFSGCRMMIPTGVHLEIPEGYYGRISPRSGFAKNFGISVLGGVVDSDYRGEVFVGLQNSGDANFYFDGGDRIAQIVFLKHETFDLVPVIALEHLQSSDRGHKGFGSTGIK